MKKNLLLFLMVLLLPSSTFAYDFMVDGIYYNRNTSTQTATVTTYKSYSDRGYYSGIVHIPEEVVYNGVTYSVTSIGNSAFYGCSSLTEVSIPNSVTSIGYYAFYGCSSLTEVSIPNSVTSIGNYAFSGCSSLTEVTISDGEGVLSFDNSATFSGCPIETLYLGRNISYSSSNSPFSNKTSLKNLSIGNSVTSIGSSAFSGCSNLTEVTIPNSVTSIGENAFYCCSSLTEVTIPNSVTSIGEKAFSGCSSLTEVTIPNSVTSIDSYAFSGCSSLTEVTIPNSVTSIDSYAFSGCSSLTEVTISDGEGVLSFSSTPFNNCPIETLYLGRNISYYSSYSPFRDKTSLKNLSIGNSVTSIDKSDFSGCSGYKLISYATTPPTLNGALNATSLEVPIQTTCLYAKSKYWEEIAHIYAIENNRRYYPVIIDQEGGALVTVNGVQSDVEVAENSIVEVKPIMEMEKCYLVFCDGKDIVDDLFTDGLYTFTLSKFHEKNLVKIVAYPQTNITVSNSGTLLDAIGIENVDNIYFLKVSGNLNGTDILAIRKMTNLRLLDMGDANIVNGGQSYYQGYITSENEIGAYFFQGKTNLSKIILPKTITSIGSVAFGGMTDLVSISIPNSVTSIGNSAFSGCSSLTEVSIGNSVTSIGNSAFYGCSSLTEVTIGNSVTSIGSSAFEGCSSLTEVTIPNSVTSIYSYAFRNCSSLTEVTIPNSVTSIGYSAFAMCSSLTEVSIGNSVTSIGENAFYDCSSLTEVTIGNSVTSIGEKAFSGCSSLTEVTIPNSVTSIGNSAFYGCSSLTEVTIGNSVTSIGEKAFSGCSSLTEVTIPNSVTSIGENAFYCCSSLTEVTIGNSVTSIGKCAFQGCSSLTEVAIPNSVTSIGDYAFDWCSSLTEVTISDGESVLSISTTSYDNCPIETLYLGRNIRYINSNSPFRNKTSLKNLSIGNSVTFIGEDAFSGCSAIISVTSLNPTPPVITASTFDETTEKNVTLHVPEGCKTIYWLHPYWENFFSIQDDVLTSVENVPTDGQNRQIENSAIYTVDGVKLNTTNLSDLPSGIYIINGKKYVVN